MIRNQYSAAPPGKATFHAKKFCTNAIDQNQETPHYLHEKTKFSVADLLSRSFFLEQLQLIELKQTITSPSSICNTDP